MSDLETNLDNFFAENEIVNYSPFSQEVIDEFKNGSSDYLAFYYWEDGFNCDILDRSEILNLANKMISAEGDSSFRTILFDKNGKALQFQVSAVTLKNYEPDSQDEYDEF